MQRSDGKMELRGARFRCQGPPVFLDRLVILFPRRVILRLELMRAIGIRRYRDESFESAQGESFRADLQVVGEFGVCGFPLMQQEQLLHSPFELTQLQLSTGFPVTALFGVSVGIRLPGQS